jgi:outer membrane protein
MKFGIRHVIWIAFCIFLLPSLPHGQTKEKVLELSLQSCIDRALKENLNLQSTVLGLRSDNLSIIQQQSRFDPSLNLMVTHAESSRPNFLNYIATSNTNSKTSSADLQLSQMLRTGSGANWGLGLYSDLSKSNIQSNQNYSSYIGLNITQPLLRNFGRQVAESGIYIAALMGKMTELQLENNALSLIYNVQNDYWNLVYARKTLDVLRIAVAQAESLLANNQMGQSLGLLTQNDVLEAKSGVLARKRDVLDQINAVKTSEDALKYLLHFNSPDDLLASIVPTDSIPIPEITIDDQKLYKEALAHRPDYLSTRTAAEQNKIQATVARNAMLPGLDLSTSYKLNGSGITYSKDLKEMGTGNSYGWEVDLNLSYPLGNRNAKTAYEKSMINLKKTQLGMEDLEMSIQTDLRAAIRNVTVNRQKIDEMALEVEVNRQKLDMEEESFRNHLSTSYLVLTYQNDLAASLNLYNQALINYNLSVVKLKQTTGTLLQDMHITIVDLYK